MTRYSPSRVKTFDLCLLKYKLHYIEKIEMKGVVRPETVFGNYFHAAAEIFNGKNKEELVDLVSKFPGMNKEFLNYIAPCLKSFFLFYKKYSKYLFETESKKEIEIDYARLYGIVDRVMHADKGIIFVDYKTGKNTNQKYHMFQMRFYNFMLSKLLKKDPKDIKCIIFYPRVDHESKIIFSNKEIDLFEKELRDKIVKIEMNKIWKPNPAFMCRYCDYCNTRYCKYGKSY